MVRMIKTSILMAIRGYRKYISPYTLPACRFTPTCSQYAYDAVLLLPWYKAIFYIFYRILRCGPWSRGGYDPVLSTHNVCKG